MKEQLYAPAAPELGIWGEPFPALSCTFCCNSRGLIISKDSRDKPHKYFVQCPKCGARGPLSEDEREAVDKWNNRYDVV